MNIMNDKNRDISLVLSSGGARGMAHIGVIEELEKLGYHIRSVSGTSVGALIGGLYASGHLQEFKEWVANLDKMDVFHLIDLTISTQGFIKGEKVFTELNHIIGNCNIEDLNINFSAIAADITNKKEVVFRSGGLLNAIRASAAMPTILKPVIYKDCLLVDGAIVNPLPIDAVSRTENDILVAVNLNANIPYEKPVVKIPPPKTRRYLDKEKLKFLRDRESVFSLRKYNTNKIGYYNIIVRSLNMLEDKLTDITIEQYKPDILVNISRNAAETFDFHRSSEIIEAGRMAFRSAYSYFIS